MISWLSFACWRFSKIPEIKKCYYELLEVDHDASWEQIKESYFRIAKEFHPDKNPESLDYFTAVTKAYDVLYDDSKRANYDEDSLSDWEFFTIWLFGLPINLYYVFSISLLVSLGIFGKNYIFAPKQACPIDDSHKKYLKSKIQ